MHDTHYSMFLLTSIVYVFHSPSQSSITVTNKILRGIWENKSISEDEITARKVDGIDIIVSGHTHTKLKNPLMINNTMIVSAGSFGSHIDILDIILENGKVNLDNYELREIDDSVAADPVIQKKIENYTDYINNNVLEELGLSPRKVIAETDFDLMRAPEETNIGNMIADSILWYANRLEFDPTDPSFQNRDRH